MAAFHFQGCYTSASIAAMGQKPENCTNCGKPLIERSKKESYGKQLTIVIPILKCASCGREYETSETDERRKQSIHDFLAKRAYEISQTCQNRGDLENWLHAEQEFHHNINP